MRVVRGADTQTNYLFSERNKQMPIIAHICIWVGVLVVLSWGSGFLSFIGFWTVIGAGFWATSRFAIVSKKTASDNPSETTGDQDNGKNDRTGKKDS
jgi:hypothetical protein